MAFDAGALFDQAVEVDLETVKSQRAVAPQREGGGWVREVLETFDRDPREYLWVPLDAFPIREGAKPREARTTAQSLNDQARKLGLDVTAKAETNPDYPDSTEKGIGFTHEYPEKSNRGRKPQS